MRLLEKFSNKIDVFCGVVGTGGMMTGVGGVILGRFSQCRIVVLGSGSFTALPGQPAGSHSIDGSALGFYFDLFNKEIAKEVLALPESSARQMARRLAVEEVLFADTSTELNVFAAIKIAREIGTGGSVVTVACDTGFKYLTNKRGRVPFRTSCP